MLNLFKLSIALVYSLSSLTVYSKEHKILVIVPQDHKAMSEITTGVREVLANSNVEVVIKNAHADFNLLLSLIKQSKEENFDIIMPIGTSTCQATIAHMRDNKICCIASYPQPVQNLHVTGINDDVPITQLLRNIPNIKNIAIIYSANEKVTREIELLKSYAKDHGLRLQLKMIQTLLDLPSVSSSVEADTQAFLVLKDHLVVSGINILTREANKRNVPIIASDEGSVISGATIALGVKEKDIGIESGLMALEILKGTDPNTIAFKNMQSFKLFINKRSIARQNILLEQDIVAVPYPHVLIP